MCSHLPGGVDISLNYEGKDSPDLGLSKKGGRTASAPGEGEDEALEKQKLASLSLMNKVTSFACFPRRISLGSCAAADCAVVADVEADASRTSS